MGFGLLASPLKLSRRRPTPSHMTPVGRTPVVTVTLGVDAVVGRTAADFVESDVAGSAPDAPSPTPDASGARSLTPDAFASELVSHITPVSQRLLDEAARLDLVRRAALDYTPRPDEGGR